MPDRNAFLLEDAVVVVNPLLGVLGIDERKGQRADAEPRRELDRLAVGARDPQGRMRPLHRLGHDVAAGHGEIFALVTGIGIHRQHVGALLDRLAPLVALLVHRHAIAAEFEQSGGFARAPFDAALRYEIERRDALGDARGMIVVGRHQGDAVSEPDILRPLRARREKYFRRRGMRIFLEEVMLDFPGVVDAEFVGELDLIERILEQLQLIALFPGTRQLMLIEDAELHGVLLVNSCSSVRPSAPASGAAVLPCPTTGAGRPSCRHRRSCACR